jgi:hypothetical protein
VRLSARAEHTSHTRRAVTRALDGRGKARQGKAGRGGARQGGAGQGGAGRGEAGRGGAALAIDDAEDLEDVRQVHRNLRVPSHAHRTVQAEGVACMQGMVLLRVGSGIHSD